MSKEEFLKIQKCVLKVNIHCDGCKQKVKKILQKIDGVFTIEIDAEAGKVTVSGNVDPAILIKKLSKSKKYAEIWGAPKVNPNTNNGGQQNQMKNLQIENGRGGGNFKQEAQKVGNNLPKPGNGGGGRPMQISPQMLQQMQQMNGFPQLKGLPMPPFKDPVPANQKVVKFDLPEEDDLTDEDDLDDDYDDDDYDDDLRDEDDLDDTPAPPNRMKPLIGGAGAGANAGQMPNMMMMNGNMNMNMEQLMNAQKAAMGAEKKPGSGGSGAMPMNGLGSDNKGGKKGVAPNSSGGGDDDDGGKKGKAKIGNNNCFGAGLSINNGNGMPAGGMAAGGGGARPMGSMNMPMAQMGNMEMSQMDSMPAVHGLPGAAMNGNGYFPGAAGPIEAMSRNPYQQQQYMAALMNHQRPTMVNQPMMYARPPSAVNYLPPYPYPPTQPGTDNYSHFFSNENTSSCNVM